MPQILWTLAMFRTTTHHVLATMTASTVGDIANTPYPVLLLIVGCLFLFLAFGGNITHKVGTRNVNRKASAMFGAACVLASLGLQYPKVFRPGKTDPSVSAHSNVVSNVGASNMSAISYTNVHAFRLNETRLNDSTAQLR